jgi:hypothetical protein
LAVIEALNLVKNTGLTEATVAKLRDAATRAGGGA